MERFKQYPILTYFSSEHLSDVYLQKIGSKFRLLAYELAENSPPGAEASAGLRKLLEAKDCFVRANRGQTDQKEEKVA